MTSGSSLAHGHSSELSLDFSSSLAVVVCPGTLWPSSCALLWHFLAAVLRLSLAAGSLWQCCKNLRKKNCYEKPEEKLVESILALSGRVRHFLALCGTFWLFVALLGSLAVWQKPQEKV